MNLQKIIIISLLGGSPLAARPAIAAEGQNGVVEQQVEGPVGEEGAMDGQDDVILVTAQKRAQDLQDVPIAITAFGGEALKNSGVLRPEDLSGLVPNMKIGTGLGVNSVFLRGVGSFVLNPGGEASIAYHMDGVYVQSPRAQVAGYYDVERIEVLRGPQGDLYGRNATGGSVNIITRRPTDQLEANARASYGSYNWVYADAGIGGPVIDGLLKARVSGFYSNHDGFGENIATGNDIDTLNEYGMRVVAELTPSYNLSFEVVADYYRADDSLGAWHIQGNGIGGAGTPLTSVAIGGTPAKDLRDISASRDPVRDLEVYGLIGTINYEPSDNVTIRSITGYRNSEFFLSSDLAGAPTLSTILMQSERIGQFSQELTALFEGQGLNGHVGGYYFTSNLDGNVFLPLDSLSFLGPPFGPNAVFNPMGDLKTDAYAIYGHGEIDVTDALRLIVGLRYSHETRSSDGVFNIFSNFTPTGGEESWDAFTPKVMLEYSPSDDWMAYVSASRGFKSGTWVVGQPNPVIDPEYIWSYEGGMKFDAFDGVLQANLAAFYYDYTDLVVSRVVGASTIQENASSAEIYGAEAEMAIRPLDNLRFDLSVGYVNATYGNYVTADPLFPNQPPVDRAGNKLTNAPEWSLRGAVDYTIPIGTDEISVFGEVVYQSEVFFSPFNDPNSSEGGYATVNLRGAYTFDDKWHVAVFGRNVTDVLSRNAGAFGPNFVGYPNFVGLNQPRIIGLEIGFDY